MAKMEATERASNREQIEQKIRKKAEDKSQLIIQEAKDKAMQEITKISDFNSQEKE